MRSIYAEEGLLSWAVLQVTRRRGSLPRVQQLIDRAFEPEAFTAFLVVRLGTAVGLAALMVTDPHARVASAVLSSAILAELLMLKRRSTYGLDGADHMYTVVFLGLTVFWVMPEGSLASLAGLLYIGGQSVLAYLIAGIAKLRGPSWRDGSAIGGIMATKIYGNRRAAALLKGRRGPGQLACWTVIAFEITFVAVLFVDPRTVWVMLAVGVAFHASTAVFMGLNSFFLAFVATYPAVVYLNEMIHRHAL
jgi:hypothetical protein